jgi:two-component system OmpR family sensor kinase
MKLWKWLLVCVPGLLGMAFGLYMLFVAPNDPIIYLRIDLGSLAVLLGAGISALLAAYLLFWEESERRRKKILTETASERRRFLMRLDHELKNPLTAMRAGLANLAETPAGDARQEALLSVEAQTLRLSRLAGDLRKLAELEVRLVERSPVDMVSLLQEAFTLAQDQPGATERALNLSLPHAPWPLPKVSGDPDLLFLAVHNLLENAIKFTRQGDTVELRASEDGASIIIEVADTGPGIPEQEQPLVWEELYRGREGRGVPGSGLGLALVRAIAELHNGQVSLRSRSGQGTVFTLRLPAS